MMETESPQPAAPPPSRYRTVRRKLATNNDQPSKAVKPTQVVERQKPAVYAPAQEQPLARQPSKFRQILRLNTHPKESTVPAAVPRPTVTPHYKKLHKSPHSPRKVSSKREEVIESTLDKLVGRSSSRSPEKYLLHDEPVRTLSSNGTWSAYFIKF